jgi:hypothetical protein
MKDLLSSTTSIEDQNAVREALQELFTGEDETDKVKDFSMRTGDLLHLRNQRIREMAAGKVTVDIDSVLSLFTDLSMINCTIDVAVVWSPWRNLQSSVHIAYKGIALHRIPHFFLGRFGRELIFDLYIFAPKAYDRDAKIRNGVIPNLLQEETIAEFMDKWFLKAAHECIPAAQANRWPSTYEIQKAKSTAAGIEGRMYRRPRFTKHMELTVPLLPEFIPRVWKKCEWYLRREIRGSNPKLVILDTFQLFINSKGTKDRLFTDSIPRVLVLYKDKVGMYLQ